MNCFKCEQSLSAYIDDELPADDRRLIETHLEECEVCLKEYESHVTAWEAEGHLRSESAPEGIFGKIESRMEMKTPANTLEELARIVRDLAEEIRDVRQAVDYLRQDLGIGQPERDGEDLRNRLSILTVGARRRSG